MTVAKLENGEEPVVFVVEDDAPLREALKRLFRTVGLRTEQFGSAADFLDARLPDAPACLVLDVRLPGLSGLDLQTELTKRAISVPIIFVTGHGDVPMSVQAMKAGAVDFLPKPFRDQDMLDAVSGAIQRDRERRAVQKQEATLRACYNSLTPRERDVMALVTAGMMNKSIAHELGLSEITIKVRRGDVMKKMGAKSLADLVRMAEALGISRTKT